MKRNEYIPEELIRSEMYAVFGGYSEYMNVPIEEVQIQRAVWEAKQKAAPVLEKRRMEAMFGTGKK